ncbi:MAG: beta-lactamase family protein [Bacteroidales bacterium]|nr:beta-lactamase family protein [Bacteroidales bacterium]
MKNKSIQSFLNYRKCHITFVFPFIFSAVLFSAKESSDIPDTNLLDDFLKKTVKSYRIPGLAVAVVNTEGIIWMSGYGKSSPGVRITPSTPFFLGSTSKTFTALAIMRLVETGKVELDSTVKKYLPEFRLASSE